MTFLRTLASRRWLAALAVALTFSTCAFFLGRWQWHRHEAKQQRADLVNANYRAEAVDLATAFPEGRLEPSRQWTPVRVTGRYDAAHRLLVRNRPMDKFYGYEVLVPVVLDDGRAVLVDRGWLPFGDDAQAEPSVPGERSGAVTVVGWARPGERAVSRASEPRQLTAIDPGQAREATGLRLVDGYLVLREEHLAGAGAVPRPQPLKEPSTDTGPHFAYSLQWWGGMVLAPLLVLWGVRRDVAEQRAGDADAVPAPAPPRTPRSRRLWDTDTEEDEELDGAP